MQAAGLGQPAVAFLRLPVPDQVLPQPGTRRGPADSSVGCGACARARSVSKAWRSPAQAAPSRGSRSDRWPWSRRCMPRRVGRHLARRAIHPAKALVGAGRLRGPHDRPRLVDPYRLRHVDHAVELGQAMLAIDQTGIGRASRPRSTAADHPRGYPWPPRSPRSRDPPAPRRAPATRAGRDGTLTTRPRRRATPSCRGARRASAGGPPGRAARSPAPRASAAPLRGPRADVPSTQTWPRSLWASGWPRWRQSAATSTCRRARTRARGPAAAGTQTAAPAEPLRPRLPAGGPSSSCGDSQRRSPSTRASASTVSVSRSIVSP